MADLLPAADRARRADSLPARPVADAREAPPGSDQEDRSLRRPDRGRLAGAGVVLDAEWPPPSDGAAETEGEAGPRDLDPRGRSGLPDPRAQHREGAQPQGEVARGDPHVPRPRGAAAEEDRRGLRIPVRGAALRHL